MPARTSVSTSTTIDGLPPLQRVMSVGQNDGHGRFPGTAVWSENVTKNLRMLIGLAVVCGLAGCHFGGPYYTIEQTPTGGSTLTIHKTKLGDIKVELPSLPSGAVPPPGMVKTAPVSSGSGTSKGSKSSGSEKVDYEIRYTHDGRTLTIVSVMCDGRPVPRW